MRYFKSTTAMTRERETRLAVYLAFNGCTVSEMYWLITEALNEKVEIYNMTLDQCQLVLEYMRTKTKEGTAC